MVKVDNPAIAVLRLWQQHAVAFKVYIQRSQSKNLTGLIRRGHLDLMPKEYFHLGLVEVKAFAEMHPDDIQLEFSNALIYPHLCEYLITREGTGEDYIVPTFDSEEQQKEAEEMPGGVLAYRKLMVENAKTTIEAEVGEPLRSLYLKAIPEILKSFDIYRTFAERELDAIDADIEQGKAGSRFLVGAQLLPA